VTKRHKAGDGDSRPGLFRLPPGRHGLPRDYVVRNQRERITAGIVSSVAEHGYAATTITSIVAAAGVGRRTFYTYFSSKEECYLDAFDQLSTHLIEDMQSAGKAAGPAWPARVRARLAVLLDLLASNPDLVRFALIAPPAAGEEAIAGHYREFLLGLIGVLGQGAPSGSRKPGSLTQQALAGGIAALLVAKVKAGEGERLRDLEPAILEQVLTAYLGRDAAAKEARESA
jgi:AcrR family transcriptional regulator